MEMRITVITREYPNKIFFFTVCKNIPKHNCLLQIIVLAASYFRCNILNSVSFLLFL